VLLTNGAAAREPRRISPILAQVATSGSGARLFREQHFGAYRANSALNEGQAVNQRVEKVRQESPPRAATLQVVNLLRQRQYLPRHFIEKLDLRVQHVPLNLQRFRYRVELAFVAGAERLDLIDVHNVCLHGKRVGQESESEP